MRRHNSPQAMVGEEKEGQHSYKHDCALEGICVHDAFQTPHDDVESNDGREEEKTYLVVHLEVYNEELGCSHEDCRDVNRHEEENEYAAENLYEARLEAFSQKFREGMRVEVVPNCPGSVSEKDKGDEYSHEYVQEGEPEEAQSKKGCRSPKTDNGRGADECRSIGHGHDVGMGFSSGKEVIGCRFRLPIGSR